MSKITEITSSGQFDKLLGGNKFVIVDFFATWCGPCKIISPVFDSLATTYASPTKLAFAKIDTDRNPGITQQHGVSAMPTFLIFKNGSVTNTIRGASASALKDAVASAAREAGVSGGAKGVSGGAVFEQVKGRRLGSANEAPSGQGWTMPDLGGAMGALVRFGGLYFTTLFSFDAYAAAEASPFAVRGGRR